MKTWSDFYDYVLPELPGCGQDIAALYIRSTVLDFFDSAGIYTVSLTPVTTIANQGTYALVAPTGWDVAWVKSAWHDNQILTPSGEDEIRSRYTSDWTSQVGSPTYFMHEDQNTIRLVPIPDTVSAGSLKLAIRAVLKPQRDSVGFSADWVFDRWADIIATGAKAALMQIPGKMWSNPQLAAFYAAKYRVGLDDATRDANRSLTRNTSAVMMRPAA